MSDRKTEASRPARWAIALFAFSCTVAALSVYLLSTTSGAY
jgi:hypothetical protein